MGKILIGGWEREFSPISLYPSKNVSVWYQTREVPKSLAGQEESLGEKEKERKFSYQVQISAVYDTVVGGSKGENKES